MKYAVWFVRLVFAAWMIPAGINHFIRIFPQPMGSQPLSMELIRALIDSHLFDLVKAVELIAGIGLLLGFYPTLMLILCFPVSFCVWYWDTPLEGWTSRAAWFGGAVLLCNTLLAFAYFGNYKAMFPLRAKPDGLSPSVPLLSNDKVVMALRMVFGAWMLLSGINYLFVSIVPMPTGTEPGAMQLMAALVNSHLMAVAMAILLVGGALVLAGVFVPFALCVMMPVVVCAAFWAVILEHQFLGAILSLVAVALNAALMLAYISYYKGVLRAHPLAVGETQTSNFRDLFVEHRGSTPRGQYIGGLITLLATVAFYYFIVTGLTAQWCMLMLLIPGTILHARRLHDMGRSAWPLAVPAALIVGAFWQNLSNPGSTVETALSLAALVLSAAVVVWGLVGKGDDETGHIGQPAA